MKRFKAISAFSACVLAMSVLFSSCKPFSDDASVTEATEQTREIKNEPVIPLVDYEQIVKDNDVTKPMISVVIGDYLLFSDMISPNKPSKLIALNLKTGERKTLYTASKGISQIQPVDEHTLALGIPKYVELEYICYEYYYFSLDDGSVKKMTKNPSNREKADLFYPVWVNGYMIFETAESAIGECSRDHTMCIVCSVYSKTPDGITVPIAYDISSYHVEGEEIYYRLYESSVERVCDLDGTDGKDVVEDENADNSIKAGKYDVLIDGNKVYIKNTENGKTVMPEILPLSVDFKGFDSKNAYLYINDANDEDDGIISVSLDDGSVTKIISDWVYDLVIYEDFLLFMQDAPSNGEMFTEYDLFKVNKDGTGLEKLN